MTPQFLMNRHPGAMVRWGAIGFLSLLWVGTSTHGIGHIAPSGNCFSIGGGYVEYGYGWDWIRRKMICHSRTPPMGWFVHKLCPGRGAHSYAKLCIGIWVPLLLLLGYEVTRIRAVSEILLEFGPNLRVLLMLAAILAAVADLRDSLECFAAMMFALAAISIIPLTAFALRKRPRPGHCVGCGYNLFGNVSGICPECGQTIKPEWTGDSVGRPAE